MYKVPLIGKQSRLLILYSASGFLAFMSGYTVFLGPFAGIMVTDVRLRSVLYARRPLIFDFICSIGSSITVELTFHRCTDLTDDIVTPTAS